MRETILGAMMGHCVGDALGVPFEWKTREEIKEFDISQMQGYGTHNQPPGTWSDDTSLSLCLAVALTRGLDYDFIIQKYIQWFDEGFYTPFGDVFDYGSTTRRALVSYDKSKNPRACGGTEETDNGNGSLMRILPLLFYLKTHFGQDFQKGEAYEIIHTISSLTHAHPRAHIACGIYLSVANELLFSRNVKDGAIAGIDKARKYYGEHNKYKEELIHYQRLWDESFYRFSSDAINSTGYVVDTLEASLWCLLVTESYEECVLQAVQLGGDTDTISAVAGGLAGIFYGYDQIPENWINKIEKKDMIIKIINDYSDSLEK